MAYLRRWWRVRRRIFLYFFLRIRLRRFLINDPIELLTIHDLMDVHSGTQQVSQIFKFLINI